MLHLLNCGIHLVLSEKCLHGGEVAHILLGSPAKVPANVICPLFACVSVSLLVEGKSDVDFCSVLKLSAICRATESSVEDTGKLYGLFAQAIPALRIDEYPLNYHVLNPGSHSIHRGQAAHNPAVGKCHSIGSLAEEEVHMCASYGVGAARSWVVRSEAVRSEATNRRFLVFSQVVRCWRFPPAVLCSSLLFRLTWKHWTA